MARDGSGKAGGLRSIFGRIARRAADITGGPWAFLIAVLVVVAWTVTGPIFDFSDTWQLVINTGTTIVTFLMVFLIQNTQNRETKAAHLKLDELIHAVKRAHNELIEAEDLTEDQLDELHGHYSELAKRYHGELSRRRAGRQKG
jgi:low affinity Fe/Cu permease